MASVAINGLGRIGRAAIKIIEDIDGADVVAVNDLIPPDNLAYLLRYDTVHARYHKTVTATGDSRIIGGRPVPVLASRDPAGLPWADVGVDLVLECTGAFRREDDLKKHLPAGGAAGDLVGARSHGGGGDGGARGEPGTGGETGDLVRELHDQLHYPGRRGTGPPVRRVARDHGHGARLHVLPAADRRAGQGLPPRPRRHREHAARFHRCRAGDHQGPARPGRAVRRGGGPGTHPGWVDRRSCHRPACQPRGGERRFPRGGGQRPVPRDPRGRRGSGGLRRHYRRLAASVVDVA